MSAERSNYKHLQARAGLLRYMLMLEGSQGTFDQLLVKLSAQLYKEIMFSLLELEDYVQVKHIEKYRSSFFPYQYPIGKLGQIVYEHLQKSLKIGIKKIAWSFCTGVMRMCECANVFVYYL